MNAYALNVNGKSVLAGSSGEASSLIASARGCGISNIDVGIMQLNYRWHANGFASMQEMLNPKRNIEYAASFLVRLKKQHGTWHKALRIQGTKRYEYGIRICRVIRILMFVVQLCMYIFVYVLVAGHIFPAITRNRVGPLLAP